MKIRDYTFPLGDFHLNNLDLLLQSDALLLDIETTGFRADYQSIYMIGCGFLKENSLQIRLFYAASEDEEAEILKAALEFSSDFSSVITFNGEMFDLPFLKKRYSLHHLPDPFSSKVSTDLFKIAKKYKKWLDLSHYNQKTLEQFFGLFREDQYDGGRLIEVYKRQASSPSSSDEELLFLHNMEDVKGMVSLLPLREFSLLDRPEFEEVTLDTSHEKELLFLGKLKQKTNLHLRRKTDYVFLQIEEEDYRAVIRPYCGKLKYFYPDYKNYVYIPDEHLLLPKVLASSIDKSRQVKATKENCFTEKEGYFLPNILHGDEREFKESAKDKQTFVEIDPKGLSENYICEFLKAYV